VWERVRALVAWMVFVGWVIFVAVCLAMLRPAPAPNAVFVPHVPVATGASGFERALAAARVERMQALQAAKRALEEQEGRDPAGAVALDGEAWRRGVLAADRTGALHHALRAARRASALASDREEASRAVELLVMLECEAGHHREELRQAHRLVELQRRNRRSLSVLLRAARCNELEPLARQISAELNARGE
jgi:hypothetical protein